MTLKLTHKEIAKKLVLKMISFDYGSDDVPSLITELEQAFTQVANEALEEAARAADRHAYRMQSLLSDSRLDLNEVSGRSAQSVLIAKAIRALKKEQVKS